MNPGNIPAIITGIVAVLVLVIGKLWDQALSNRKNIAKLKQDANDTQIDFANTIRNELRVDNDVLHKRITNMETDYNSLKSTYLALMEQYSELRIQYAQAVTDKNTLNIRLAKALLDTEECNAKYNTIQTNHSELQSKYEHLLEQVGELRGIIDRRQLT